MLRKKAAASSRVASNAGSPKEDIAIIGPKQDDAGEPDPACGSGQGGPWIWL